MVRGSAEDVLYRYVPALYRLGPAGGLSDGQLLERYVQSAGQSSELAFEALVERHGPMVLRVCRQILGPGDDAHDAFQATFLVLVRKAHSIRKQESAASWLYGVALRVSQRARVERTRRRTREQQAAAMNAPSTTPTNNADPWPELHEEVARLPEKYRHPIVLCYFEGLSTELAAERLGCPRGTVLSRLARGRERIRKRLVRRGLAPAVALLGVTAAATSEAAAVSPALLSATLALAKQFESPTAAAALSASAAVSLAKGVLSSMSLAKLKLVSAGLVTIAALLGVPAALAFSGHTDEAPKEPPAPKATAAATPPAQAKQDVPEDPTKASRKTTDLPADEEQKVAATLEKIASEQTDLEMLDLDVAHAKEQLQKALSRAADLEPASMKDPTDNPTVRKRWENDLKRAQVDVVHWRDRYRELSKAVTTARSQLDLIAKPGDFVLVEVLMALPGRPISGTRIVGPTGIISLGFYGELQVVGLKNQQMKVKVVEHLRRFLKGEVLGLVETDPTTGIVKHIKPADSDCVCVEIDLTRTAQRAEATPPRLGLLEQKLNSLDSKLDKLIKAKE